MTGKIEQVEGITSVERRRRWSAEEKAAIAGQAWRPSAHPAKRHAKLRVEKQPITIILTQNQQVL